MKKLTRIEKLEALKHETPPKPPPGRHIREGFFTKWCSLCHSTWQYRVFKKSGCINPDCTGYV